MVLFLMVRGWCYFLWAIDGAIVSRYSMVLFLMAPRWCYFLGCVDSAILMVMRWCSFYELWIVQFFRALDEVICHSPSMVLLFMVCRWYYLFWSLDSAIFDGASIVLFSWSLDSAISLVCQ